MDDDIHGGAAVKRILSGSFDLPDGMEALLGYCRRRYRHAAWDEMAALDYAADARAMGNWFRGQLPIPDAVQVLWFALWDVVEGFDLRGSTSWSGDPDDWEWWYHDDFDAGGRASAVLASMLAVAARAEDPNEGPDVPGGVYELTEMVLSLGYVSLAALQIMQAVDPAELLGGRQELWAVSGHPDAEDGIILGRITQAGVERYK